MPVAVKALAKSGEVASPAITNALGKAIVASLAMGVATKALARFGEAVSPAVTKALGKAIAALLTRAR